MWVLRLGKGAKNGTQMTEQGVGDDGVGGQVLLKLEVEGETDDSLAGVGLGFRSMWLLAPLNGVSFPPPSFLTSTLTFYLTNSSGLPLVFLSRPLSLPTIEFWATLSQAAL